MKGMKHFQLVGFASENSIACGAYNAASISTTPVITCEGEVG